MLDDLLVRISADSKPLEDGLNSAKASVRDFASGVAVEAAKMVASLFAFEKVIESVKQAIGRSDEIRDLGLSLGVFTGSTQKATEALKFFEEQSHKTRSTAEELAHVFRDLLPLAMAKGFGPESLQQITVWLSQLGTISGKGLDDMMSGFQALLAGRVTVARNDLLKTLGIRKEDVATLGWDQLITKLQEVAGHFPDFGQSFESTMHKVKDDLIKYVGEGINEVSYKHSLATAILTGVESAESVKTLHNIGEFIGNLIKGDVIAALASLNIDKWLEQQKPQNAFKFTGSSLIPNLYDPSNPNPSGNAQDNINTGAWAARQAGITNVTDVGGNTRDWGQFLNQFGATLLQHKDMAAKIIAEVKDETHNGVLAWTDYTSSVADASKSADIVTPKLGAVAHGLIAVKNAAKDAREAIGGMAETASSLWGPGNIPLVVHTEDLPTQISLAQHIQGIQNQQQIDASAQAEARAYAKAVNSADGTSQLEQAFGQALAGAMVGGGKSFARVAAQEFNQLVQKGIGEVLGVMFGKKGDPNKGQDPNLFYDASGASVSSTRGAIGQDAMVAMNVGVGSYNNAKANPDGSVTSGIIGGALSGAAMGNIYAAVALAIIGGGSAAVAKIQSKNDYQYGVPEIDASGNVSLGRPTGRSSGWGHGTIPNTIGDVQAAQMVAQIQTVYDAIKNSMISLLLDMGQSIDGVFKSIDGKFQDNPSAHFMEHFQQWLSGTLPKELMGQVEGPLQAGFANLGMSAAKFHEIWTKLGTMDPLKVPALLSMLADALKELQTATNAFKVPTNALDFGNSSFNMMLSGASDVAHQTFAGSLAAGDIEIFKMARQVQAETGEKQFTDERALAALVTARYTSEKQFATEILAISKQAYDSIQAAKNNISIGLIRKADGTPDLEGQASFLKGLAQQDLNKIAGATNPQDAQKLLNDYIALTTQIVGIGNQISPVTGTAWGQWALKQLDTGQHAFDAQMSKLGDLVAKANTEFMKQFQPYYDGLTKATTTTDTFGDAVDRTIQPVRDFRDGINDATSAVDDFVAAMRAGTGDGFSNGVVARRQAA